MHILNIVQPWLAQNSRYNALGSVHLRAHRLSDITFARLERSVIRNLIRKGEITTVVQEFNKIICYIISR